MIKIHQIGVLLLLGQISIVSLTFAHHHANFTFLQNNMQSANVVVTPTQIPDWAPVADAQDALASCNPLHCRKILGHVPPSQLNEIR